MKLRNKKTGEIVPASNIAVGIGNDGKWYDSLAELNAEWEDVPEEPKEHWCINEFGTPEMAGRFSRESIYDKSRKLIGNDFDTREEAEKAVEKLKAWKRLKDKGFEFFDNKIIGEYGNVSYTLTYPATTIEEKDLDLLFGGEE